MTLTGPFTSNHPFERGLTIERLAYAGVRNLRAGKPSADEDALDFTGSYHGLSRRDSGWLYPVYGLEHADGEPPESYVFRRDAKPDDDEKARRLINTPGLSEQFKGRSREDLRALMRNLHMPHDTRRRIAEAIERQLGLTLFIVEGWPKAEEMDECGLNAIATLGTPRNDADKRYPRSIEESLRKYLRKLEDALPDLRIVVMPDSNAWRNGGDNQVYRDWYGRLTQTLRYHLRVRPQRVHFAPVPAQYGENVGPDDLIQRMLDGGFTREAIKGFLLGKATEGETPEPSAPEPVLSDLRLDFEERLTGSGLFVKQVGELRALDGGEPSVVITEYLRANGARESRAGRDLLGQARHIRDIADGVTRMLPESALPDGAHIIEGRAWLLAEGRFADAPPLPERGGLAPLDERGDRLDALGGETLAFLTRRMRPCDLVRLLYFLAWALYRTPTRLFLNVIGETGIGKTALWSYALMRAFGKYAVQRVPVEAMSRYDPKPGAAGAFFEASLAVVDASAVNWLGERVDMYVAPPGQTEWDERKYVQGMMRLLTAMLLDFTNQEQALQDSTLDANAFADRKHTLILRHNRRKPNGQGELTLRQRDVRRVFSEQGLRWLVSRVLTTAQVIGADAEFDLGEKLRELDGLPDDEIAAEWEITGGGVKLDYWNAGLGEKGAE